MLSGEPFASAVFPFAPPVSRTVWGWLLMKPATSTKLALFCCYFYSTAGAVMQVFFYKTVTFWGCVDEVTEFRCCFWLFCTMEMAGGRAQRARRGISLRGGTGASAASPQGDQPAGRYRGERSEPAGGSACGERTRRPAHAVRRAAPPAGGHPPLLRRRGERSEPAGGSACGEGTRRPARAVRRAAPPAGGRTPLLRRRGGAGCCGVQGIKKQTPCK